MAYLSGFTIPLTQCGADIYLLLESDMCQQQANNTMFFWQTLSISLLIFITQLLAATDLSFPVAVISTGLP